jgi:phospholipid/cholesterol/gamma-HCH transport system substrate-binding protein
MNTPRWRAPKPRSIESRAWLAFAFFLLAGLGAGLAWYLRIDRGYAAYQLRTGDAVSGLMVDAPVEFHGVEVGRVAQIELGGPRSVAIVLKIRKGTPLSAATRATITARGLAPRGFMGYVYVALDDVGDAGAGPLALDAVSHLPLIAAAPSLSVNMDASFGAVGADVQVLTGLMQAALNRDALEALDASLHNLERVSKTLAANSERLNAILANADKLGRQAAPLLDSGGDSLKAMQSQLLPQAYRTLAELEAASRALAGAADKLNRNPSVLIRGSALAPPGPGEADGKR